jgi:hypothetical protein
VASETVSATWRVCVSNLEALVLEARHEEALRINLSLLVLRKE